MALLFNIRHLEQNNLFLKGELTVAEMEMETLDELIGVTQPLHYNLQVQKLEDGILVQGSLVQMLDCECARCLKAFSHRLSLDNWTCHLAMEGEDKVPVVNDCVDLTPYIREDIFLAFPQRPLCGAQCSGLTGLPKGEKLDGVWESNAASSAWAELNKLKL